MADLDQLEIITDLIDEGFKTTAIKTARDMPKHGTIEERSKFFHDQMIK